MLILHRHKEDQIGGKLPKFSIIAVDYEFHVPRDGMKKGLDSLKNQTFKDFELIIIHDGNKTIPYHEEYDFIGFKNPVKILNTPFRFNDWGHSSRDLGMRNAIGDYFIQFNIDNFFYPTAFEKISQKIDETFSSVVIFTVRHFKLLGGGELSGLPPRQYYIDAMQLVAHRNVWDNIGYWYNRTETSDGIIYQNLCEIYEYTHIPECLGENY